MLRTFFRHFCLYEYSFKPKVDLILMTVPQEIPNKSANVSKLTGGGSQFEASNMSKQIGELDLAQMEGVEPPGMDAEEDEEPPLGEDESAPKIDAIDWDKVGKIYKPESAIEDIISREVGRLGKAFEMSIEAQDVELEEKHKGGGKKK